MTDTGFPSEPFAPEFCRDCGAQRIARFRFCRVCGLDYDALDASGEPPYGPYTPPLPPDRQWRIPLRVRVAGWLIRTRRRPGMVVRRGLRAALPVVAIGVLIGVGAVAINSGFVASIASAVGSFAGQSTAPGGVLGAVGSPRPSPVSPTSEPAPEPTATPTPTPLPQASGTPGPAPSVTPIPTPIDSLRAYTSVDPVAVAAGSKAILRGEIGVFTWRTVTFATPSATVAWSVSSTRPRGCRVAWKVAGSGASGGSEAAAMAGAVAPNGISVKAGSRVLTGLSTVSTVVVTSTCPTWSLTLQGVAP